MRNYSVRIAEREDLPDILAITKRYAFNPSNDTSRGTLLPLQKKDVEYLIDQGRFFVAFLDNDYVIGCASVVQRNSTAELRSLAVDERYQEMGVASRLISTCEDLAAVDNNKLYALRQQPGVFEKNGYQLTQIWPEKLEEDCNGCPIKPVCPETPVVKILR